MTSDPMPASKLTRCRVCNCKLKSGDICPRCEREQEWLNTPEYFCTSSLCGRFLPGATEPGLCPACEKFAEIPEKPLRKPTKSETKVTKTETKPEPEAKSEPKIEPQEEKMLTSKSTELCKVCGKRLTKNGHCFSCAMKGKRNRAENTEVPGAKEGGRSVKTYPAPPAPKTSAEKPICNETPKSVTQVPPNVKPGHVFREMPGVGEYCPGSTVGEIEEWAKTTADTIHASPPPEKTEPETSWQAKSIAELPISLRELQRIAHENAVQKGWHETRRSDGEMICLMHSELSEALEELRNGKAPSEVYFKDQKPEGVPIELADVVIRVFDFCGLHNIDLQAAIVTKMVYNQTRPHRHGGKKL